MLQKALLFPFGPRLERGLQDVKKLPSSCREGLQAALMLGGFFKGLWSTEAPSWCLRVSLSKRYSPNPAWGPASLQRLVRWSPIFLMSFTSSSRKWFSRKSQMWVSPRAAARPCRSNRAWVRFFSTRRVASIASWVYPTHLEMASLRPGRGRGLHAGFAVSGDAPRPRVLLGQFAKKVTHTLQRSK